MFALLCLIGSIRAATAQGAADTEARLRLLERRISELESQLEKSRAAEARHRARSDKTAGQVSGSAAPSAPQSPAGAAPTTTGALVPTASEGASEEEKQRAREAAAKARTEAAKTTPPPEQASKQATFLFRDTTPTLDSRQLEISADASYLRGTGFLQTDRAAMALLSARYGIVKNVELGVIVPYAKTWRETQTFGSSVRDHAGGLGDITVQALATLLEQTASRPGLAATATLATPTGDTPYVFENYRPGADPRSFFKSVPSRGHWATGANLQFFKTYDPLVFFFGGGLEYTFDREVSGHTLQPGLKWSYNAGMSLALSEFTTLGVQVLGSFEERLKVDGIKVTSAPGEQLRSRFVVIQRLDTDLYLEPSVTLGLTDETPDIIVGVGVRKRM